MVRCARCHRVLTDPGAIEAGYGAKCYAREFGKKLKSPAKCRPERRRTGTPPKSQAGEQIVGQLSGGNQQKVVIGKWVNTDADIFIFLARNEQEKSTGPDGRCATNG